MLSIPVGDSFWTSFEKERDKYVSDNIDKLKKEKLIANRLVNDDYQAYNKQKSNIVNE